MTRWPVLSLLFAFVLGGESRPPPNVPLLRSILDLAHLAGDGGSPADEWTLTELERIAAMVRETVRRQPAATEVSAMNKIIFDTLGFVREVDDADLQFVLLPSVLKSRRGSCLGLGTLYLSLGEILGWKVEALMVPGHFFVRVEGTNVELLRRGEAMSGAWYRSRFPVAGEDSREYERPLSRGEILGVIEYDIGNERRRQGRLFEARESYQRAARHFPDFAEAHASLGATLHLLGNLPDAEHAYQAARRQNPELPGLDANMELLERERRDPLSPAPGH